MFHDFELAHAESPLQVCASASAELADPPSLLVERRDRIRQVVQKNFVVRFGCRCCTPQPPAAAVAYHPPPQLLLAPRCRPQISRLRAVPRLGLSPPPESEMTSRQWRQGSDVCRDPENRLRVSQLPD